MSSVSLTKYLCELHWMGDRVQLQCALQWQSFRNINFYSFDWDILNSYSECIRCEYLFIVSIRRGLIFVIPSSSCSSREFLDKSEPVASIVDRRKRRPNQFIILFRFRSERFQHFERGDIKVALHGSTCNCTFNFYASVRVFCARIS